MKNPMYKKFTKIYNFKDILKQNYWEKKYLFEIKSAIKKINSQNNKIKYRFRKPILQLRDLKHNK